MKPITINLPTLEARGVFSLGLFLLTVLILALAALFPDLRKDDFFKTVGQAIVLTGLINLAAAYYFGSSKGTTPSEPPQPIQPPQGGGAPEASP